MEELYQQQLLKRIMAYYYEQFESFITRKWCDYKLPQIIRDTDRKYAYKRFYRIVKNENVANRQTIRKWFGLSDNKSTPNRNQIFKIAFALNMTLAEAEDYLKNGISDAGFHVNDYEEFMMMYCLDNGIDYEQYQKMLEFYERKCEKDCEWEQTSHTQWLVVQYENIKDLSVEDFLVWMCKNQKYFKGYSLTLLYIYHSLIERSLQYVRRDIKSILMRELEPTGFFQWAKRHNINEPYEAQDIERFVKNKSRQKCTSMTADIVKEIRYLLAGAYASKDRMTDLISEIYTFSSGKTAKKGRKGAGQCPEIIAEIKRVDSKYISELLHIAVLKEEQMKRKIHIAGIEDEEEKKEEKKKLAAYSQRIHQVQRNDLLILIQYVFYKRVMTDIEDRKYQYNRERAKEDFCEYANGILETCGMRLLNESYLFDAMVFACFGEKDMYLFSEILEV